MPVFGYKFKRFLLLLILVSIAILINGTDFRNEPDVIIQQVPLESNNIRAWIFNTGIFDADFSITGKPGFEWPKDSGKFAVFSAGLSIAAFVNSQLRMAAASWKGECAPGYVVDSSGFPRARTDSRFKLYSVKRTDNWINNPDWLNWGNMVSFGAPFVDVNNNGSYEYLIDTPGIKGAFQTVFGALTDGFPEEHKVSEGFGGGTLPLYAELRITAWGYDNPGYQDIQFLKWVIINNNNSPWEKTYFSIVADPDLGNAADDYIGCDTSRNLMYCYNSDNEDEGGIYSYGLNPPAVGMFLCKGAVNKNIFPPVPLGVTSMTYFRKTSNPYPHCEAEPNGNPAAAYNFMKGFKGDGTSWVVPGTNPPQITKFCYTGDPESGLGLTEYTGSIWNCGDSLQGNWVSPNLPADRRFLMSSGAENLTVNPGDTQTIIIAQLIARGTNHKNSVTKLKELTQNAIDMCSNGFVIGIDPVTSKIPGEFKLYQNYPNPFNPITTIKFDIPSPLYPPEGGKLPYISLVVYDLLGREVDVLINEELKPGSYKVIWDAAGYASGVYYYVLQAGDYSFTKKMVLIK